MTEFVWRDGERTIRFGAGSGAHAWPGVDVLTTARAERDIPRSVLEGARVHHVPSGQVPDLAAALIDRVGDGRMVAWGGGRVIDTAKALAAARGGEVCAVPTTLSGAEMSRGHRPAPGYEGRPNHRPVLVLAAPELMAGQPDDARRASAMNALAHAAEALYGPGRNPVASMAALRGCWAARPGRRGGRAGRPGAGGGAGRVCAGLGRVLAPPRALPDGGAGVRDVAFGDQRRRAAAFARGDGGARAGGDRRAGGGARHRARRPDGPGLGARRRSQARPRRGRAPRRRRRGARALRARRPLPAARARRAVEIFRRAL